MNGDTVIPSDMTETIDGMIHAIRSGHHCILLTGAAGTGKTTLLEGLLARLGQDAVLSRYGLSLMAPTGRAARVLSSRTGFHARTIHSSIYDISRSERVEEEGSQQGTSEKIVYHLSDERPQRTIFVIDEASMVGLRPTSGEFLQFGSGALLTDILRFTSLALKKKGVNVVLFVGDPFQLPPVGESGDKTPPALDPELLETMIGERPVEFRLEKILRQNGGGSIIRDSTKLREGLARKIYNHYAITPDGEEIIETRPEDLPGLSIGVDDNSILVAWTHAAVWKYNESIRKWNRRDSEPLLAGERLLSLQNTIATGLDGTARHSFANGDFLRLHALPPTPPVVLTGFFRGKESQTAEAFRFTFREMVLSFTDVPEEGYFKVLVNITPIVSPEWRENEEHARIALRNAVRRRIREENPDLAVDQRERKALLSPLAYAPIVTYGYAVTCHKAQGGEWERVCVDYSYGSNRHCCDYFRWAYTATTRARRQLFALHPPKEDALRTALEGLSAVSDPREEDRPSDDSTLEERLRRNGITLESVEEYPYSWHLLLKEEHEAGKTGKVILSYNKKRRVTSLQFDKLPGELNQLLEPLCMAFKGKTLDSIRAGGGESAPMETEPPVSEPLLPRPEELTPVQLESVERIRAAASGKRMPLHEIKRLTPYQLRFLFGDEGEGMVFDLHFNKKGEINPGGLSVGDDLRQKLLEGLDDE